MFLQLSCWLGTDLPDDGTGYGFGVTLDDAGLLLLYHAERHHRVRARRPDRVLGYPGPGGYTVSLVVMVAVSVAAAVVAASVPLAPRKAGPCSPP